MPVRKPCNEKMVDKTLGWTSIIIGLGPLLLLFTWIFFPETENIGLLLILIFGLLLVSHINIIVRIRHLTYELLYKEDEKNA